MTKVFALLSVAAVFAFASCGEKKAEVSTEDTAAVVVPVEAAPVVDTVTKAVDTVATAAPAEAPKH